MADAVLFSSVVTFVHANDGEVLVIDRAFDSVGDGLAFEEEIVLVLSVRVLESKREV